MKGRKARKEEQETPDVCGVCRGSHWSGDDFEQLRCSNCDQVVHKNCYAPDFKDRDKVRFKCDPCRKKGPKGRETRHTCSLCLHTEGILKEVGTQ